LPMPQPSRIIKRVFLFSVIYILFLFYELISFAKI